MKFCMRLTSASIQVLVLVGHYASTEVGRRHHVFGLVSVCSFHIHIVITPHLLQLSLPYLHQRCTSAGKFFEDGWPWAWPIYWTVRLCHDDNSTDIAPTTSKFISAMDIRKLKPKFEDGRSWPWFSRGKSRKKQTWPQLDLVPRAPRPISALVTLAPSALLAWGSQPINTFITAWDSESFVGASDSLSKQN